MSDPLSVTASILAVVGAGLKVAQGLYQLANGIGSAGVEVRVYAGEIDSFSKLLQRVRDQLLARPGEVSTYEQGLLEDIVDVCKRVLDPIRKIQEKLNPLLVHFKESPSRLRSFGLRVQWMFSSKEKLLFYRGALRGQHRLLDTTLELMILQSTKDKSPQNIYVLQISLENSINGIKNVLNESKQLRIGDSSTTPPQRLLTAAVSSSSNRTSTPPPSPSHPSEPPEKAESVSGDAQDDLQQQTKEGVSGALVLSNVNVPVDDIDVEEVAIEEELDADFDDVAQDLWEDMRVVSRKVLRYASDVLRASQEDSPEATTFEAGPSAPNAAPPSDLPAHPVNGEDAEAKNNAKGVQGGRAQVDDYYPRYQNAQSSIRSLPKKTLDLRNADGHLIEIPFEEVKEWRGMDYFLRNLYPLNYNNGTREEREMHDAIEKGKYDLLGPQRQNIRPNTWGRVVQPGWTVELRFHDPLLNTLTKEQEQADMEEMKRQLEVDKARLDLEKQRNEMNREMQVLKMGPPDRYAMDLDKLKREVDEERAHIDYVKQKRDMEREVETLRLGRWGRLSRFLKGR